MADDLRIGIIGAGPSGLSAASALTEQGYTNVVILEKSDRTGGKTCSVPVKDDEGNPLLDKKGNPIIIEYGTAQIHPSPSGNHHGHLYHGLDKIMDDVGLGKKSLIDFAPTKIKHSIKSPAKSIVLGFGKFHVSTSHFAIFRGLTRLSRETKGSDMVGQQTNDDAKAGKPIFDFRIKSGKYVNDVLVPRFSGSNGGPNTNRMPFLYFQKYVQYFERYPFWKKIQGKFPSIIHGNEEIWNRLKKDMDIRLNCNIKEVCLDGDQVIVKTENESFHFDKIIWACDATQFRKVIRNTTQEGDTHYLAMREYFHRIDTAVNKVIKLHRIVQPAEVENLPSPILWFMTDEIASTRYKIPGMLISAGDSNFYNFYCWLKNDDYRDSIKREQIIEEVRANVIKLGERMGYTIKNFFEPRFWDWAPHFNNEDIQDGIIGRIEQMQGQANVYFVGELLGSVGISHVSEHASLTVKRHFPKDARPPIDLIVKPIPPAPGKHVDITRIMDGNLDFNAYSRKELNTSVDIDRAFIAPKNYPEWALEPEYEGLRFAYRQYVETYGEEALATYWEAMKPPEKLPFWPLSWLYLLGMKAMIWVINLSMFIKGVFPSRGFRATHRLSIGCRAEIEVVGNDNLPLHSDFFSKKQTYQGRLRYSQTSYQDNCTVDVKSMSLKFKDDQTGGPLTLTMQTCSNSTIWSLRYFVKQIMTFVKNRSIPGANKAQWKQRAAAFWPATIKLACRDLESYADNVVYTQYRYHLKSDDGQLYAIDFRALPKELKDPFNAHQPDPKPFDENVAAPELWMTPRDIKEMAVESERYADGSDTRAPDYLIEEMRRRLVEKTRPVKYFLQMQCREVKKGVNSLTDDMYNSLMPWPASQYPWHTFAHVTVTEPLEDRDNNLSMYRVTNLPKGVSLPRSYHWNDYTSTMATRAIAEGIGCRMRRWVYKRALKKGFDPYYLLARAGGNRSNWPANKQPNPPLTPEATQS